MNQQEPTPKYGIQNAQGTGYLVTISLPFKMCTARKKEAYFTMIRYHKLVRDRLIAISAKTEYSPKIEVFYQYDFISLGVLKEYDDMDFKTAD